MNAQAPRPSDTDGATDWFARFFYGVNLRDIPQAFGGDDSYGVVRTACILSRMLREGYVWDQVWDGDPDEFKELLDDGIEILSRMIDPADRNNAFLELWNNDPDVMRFVHAQIEKVKAARSAIP